MSHSLFPKLRIAALSVASTLLAIAPGCSSGGGANIQPTTAPLAITNNSHSTGAGAIASANNPRDLAAAQPDTLITGQGGARDVDLSDDGGGGGGGNMQVLTTQALGEMLQSMGLKPTLEDDHYNLELKTTINGTAYVFPIVVSIAPNHTVVWIMCNTGNFEHGGVTGEALMNLLVANFELAPASFGVTSKARLELELPITNSGVTPQVLNYNLKKFLACLKASEPLYRGFINQTGGGGGDQGGDNPFK